jgi:hypothetical protein
MKISEQQETVSFAVFKLIPTYKLGFQEVLDMDTL